MTVHEIGRYIAIDPVEHVNNIQGIEDTPVGHIISHMAIEAPKHYLICDGSEYNIVDYPYLAQHFTEQFEVVNYFGGDGINTFAVPDLRGEFLRGSGTASRNTGSGSEVGVHQEPTNHITIGYTINGNSGGQLYIPNLPDTTKDGIARASTWRSHVDRTKRTLCTNGMYTNGTRNATVSFSSEYNQNLDNQGMYTSRPTNTSVLYCIKYEPTYFFMTVPTEQVSQEISVLKEQNDLLKIQNELMQKQINQLAKTITSINREE